MWVTEFRRVLFRSQHCIAMGKVQKRWTKVSTCLHCKVAQSYVGSWKNFLASRFLVFNLSCRSSQKKKSYVWLGRNFSKSMKIGGKHTEPQSEHYRLFLKRKFHSPKCKSTHHEKPDHLSVWHHPKYFPEREILDRLLCLEVSEKDLLRNHFERHVWQ